MRGIRTIGDLASITPGLVFSQQNNFGTPQTNIEIRGIQSRTSAPTTGIYLDDTPMIGRANNVNTGQDGGYPQVFDLERVEVLRGPQGTSVWRQLRRRRRALHHQAAEPHAEQRVRTRIDRGDPTTANRITRSASQAACR